MGSGILGDVGSGNVKKLCRGSKPVSSILPCFLLEVPALSSYLTSLYDDYKLSDEINPLLLTLFWVMVFTTATENMVTQAVLTPRISW